MAIAKVGVDRCKDLKAISPLTDKNTLPPFWIVSTTDTTIEKMERSDITAFVIFWYDNLQIVSNRRSVRDDIQNSIKVTTKAMEAKWKVSAGFEKKSFTYGDDAFTTPTNNVEYLGLCVNINSGKATWLTHTRISRSGVS